MDALALQKDFLANDDDWLITSTSRALGSMSEPGSPLETNLMEPSHPATNTSDQLTAISCYQQE